MCVSMFVIDCRFPKQNKFPFSIFITSILGFPYLWLMSFAQYCSLSSVCILLYKILPDCLLLCQQCDPYNLVKQAIQKSMAITQVIDFSTPFRRWTFVVTSEMICQCRMAKFTLLAKLLFNNLQSSSVY